MISIPEITIHNLITTLLNYVKVDLVNNQGNLKESYLYQLFEDQKYDKFVLFEQGRSILAKNAERALQVSIGYNIQRAAMPTIHIVIPADNNGQTNGLSFDLGYNDKITNRAGTQSQEVFSRSFECNYALLITTTNIGELLFIFHLLRALIIGAHYQFELNGFENLKLSSQDITLQQDLAPVEIFHRTLMLNFNFEENVPDLNHQLELKADQIKFIGTSVIE